jgi:hypothetical protein
MDRHEEAVMQLMTANGDTFIAAHYDVAAGWMRPSLVALRPAKKQVWVVEVSASGYPLGLVDTMVELRAAADSTTPGNIHHNIMAPSNGQYALLRQAWCAGLRWRQLCPCSSQ